MSQRQGSQEWRKRNSILIAGRTDCHRLTRDRIAARPILEHNRPASTGERKAGNRRLLATALLNSHSAHLLVGGEPLEHLLNAILNECLHALTFRECQQFSGTSPALDERFHAVGNHH